MRIETGRQRNPPDFIIRDGLETKKRKAKVKNLHGIKKKAMPKEYVQKINQKISKRKKYTIANTESDGSPAIEMLNTVQTAGSAAVHTGGMIRTAVKGTADGIGSIRTMAKSGIRIGTAKDAGRIATAVRNGFTNVVKDTGNRVLKTQIDKSKITDTGTEAIKQGITDIRYADNTRKAIVNAKKYTVKGVNAVRNAPKNAKAQLQRMKKNAERAKKAAQAIKKVLSSKVVWIILIAAALIILIIILFSGFVSLICSAVSSLFAWMCPDGDTSDTSIKNTMTSYITQIQQCEKDIQAEIDAVVNSLSPEYRYDGTQIEGLNKFGNSKLQLCDYNAVLAVLATQKYKKVLDSKKPDFKFTKEEIRSAVELFYQFNYQYKYGYCPKCDCSIAENYRLSFAEKHFLLIKNKYNPNIRQYEMTMQIITYEHTVSMKSEIEIFVKDGRSTKGEVYCCKTNGMWVAMFTVTPDLYRQIDWKKIYMTVTAIYCDNPNHCYLTGSVQNNTINQVLQKAGFNKDEKQIFEIYLTQIEAVMGG